jgi:formylglycine-generating enzyme required for sulfatase activity
MAGNVNNWTSDWYWPPFLRYCAEGGHMEEQPEMDDALRQRLQLTSVCEKVDRGGGFATARECHEVLGCTRKLSWPPGTRQPWNGFRTALDYRA